MTPIRVTRVFLCVAIAFGAAISASPESPDKVFPSADKVEPLKVGDTVPSVTVKTLAGEDVDLRVLATRQPTVTVFYRGGWCPYCNKHLVELKDAMKGLEEMGYQVLAIGTDAFEKMKVTKEKEELPYTLLSDSATKAAAAFGIAFQLDPATVEKYKGYGIDLSASEWQLPVPAVLVSRADGTIAFVHADPDYKKRLSTAAVLDAARESLPAEGGAKKAD